MSKRGTAILFFANRPEIEAIRKPLFPDQGLKVNTTIYRSLQDDVFEKLSPLGIPVIHKDDRQQRGDDFASRICSSLGEVFEEGYDKVLILGNDSPELSTTTIQRSLELMEQGNNCLLKSHSGGSALIGIKREDFNEKVWMELEWQTSSTFNELFDTLPTCKVIDKEVIDLNDLSDVHLYLELHRGRTLIAHVIETIISPMQEYEIPLHLGGDASMLKLPSFRGPPFTA